MYPILFSIGDSPVRAYGLLLAVALILGWVLSLRLAKADKLPADVLGTAYVVAVAGGLLVARAMWLFQSGDFDPVKLIEFQAGGFSGFGGLLAGTIIAAAYAQSRKVPPWAWLDAAAPAFLIGVVIERSAAFMAGADFGHYVDPSFFLGVQFPADSPVHAVQRAQLSGLRVPADMSLPVHPSQLYAAACAAVGVVGCFLVRARRQYSGQVALFAFAFYGVVRYLIEDPFRYDSTPDIGGPVTLGQITAVVIVGLVAVAHFARLRELAQDPKAVRQWLGGPWTPGWDDGKKSKKKTKGKKGSKKSSKTAPKKAAKPSSKTAPKGD